MRQIKNIGTFVKNNKNAHSILVYFKISHSHRGHRSTFIKAVIMYTFQKNYFYSLPHYFVNLLTNKNYAGKFIRTHYYQSGDLPG